MKYAKNITKITIETIPLHSHGSILTITDTSISHKDKSNSKPIEWLYQSSSYEFRFIFIKITELIQKHLEPTPENSEAEQYEISITYDDNSNFTIKHSSRHLLFEELFGEIHKLIPPLEDIPLGFDTEESYEKRVEDLGGNMKNKVYFEDTEEWDID